ncbi:MAG: glycosyltransferase family 2 protein [Desulfobacteraceae bacterium]|nr:glycosyltransferase family 2 protein [Desulfobacteraceae bacterium]
MRYYKTQQLMISVVLCTCNRAELLAAALDTLCKQLSEKSACEVIVVDNNSKDSTPDIVKNFCRDYPNIRYFLETHQGLSHARNRGWQEAGGLYVAYVDDDCRMPAPWLTIAIEIINKIAPAVFGGPYFAFYNSPKPYWWKDSYGSYEKGRVSRPLSRFEYLRGGNIFFRRKILEDMKGFEVRLGMSGQTLGYGEETHLQRRIRLEMPNEIIYYDPRLYNYHLVRSEKMCIRWRLYSHFVNGRNSNEIFQKTFHETGRLNKLELLCRAVLTLFKLQANLLNGLLLRDRKQYPYMNNYLCENTSKYFTMFGKLYEEFKAQKP